MNRLNLVFLMICGMLFLAGCQAREPIVVESIYTFDIEDRMLLVHFSDNVFVGTVVGEHSRLENMPFPQTLFTVQVKQNLKGAFKEELILVNHGGGQPEEGVIMVDEDPLLIPGQDYVFVTSGDDTSKYHTHVPIYGNILLDKKDKGAYEATIADFNKMIKEAEAAGLPDDEVIWVTEGYADAYYLAKQQNQVPDQ